MKIIADLHTHTRYSHGKGTVMDNVSVAMARGLEAVGITDHGPRSSPWVATPAKDFAALRREVMAVDQRAPSIRVLAGVECNIISAKGELDLSAPLRHDLDLVFAGLHPGVVPASGRDWLLLAGNNWAAKFSTRMRKRARAINTEAVVAAVHTNQIDLITHPGYHLDIDTNELAKACALRGTAMEINARHHEMTVAFVRAAARQGVRFLINSDAHRPGDVGHLARGIAVAMAAGLEPEQVINSDRGGLFEWLAGQRRRRQEEQSDWMGWASQDPLEREGGEKEGPGRPDLDGRRSTWSDWSQQGGKVH